MSWALATGPISLGGGFDTDLMVDRLSEEHAVAEVASGTTRFEPGDLVRVLPNHSCVVSNLFDQAGRWKDGRRSQRCRLRAPLGGLTRLSPFPAHGYLC
jgi:D-serine deaminase-like pyridoxal phosphate-dependent protein